MTKINRKNTILRLKWRSELQYSKRPFYAIFGARRSWQQLPFATLIPFARLLYFNVETLPFARITIRNTVTIRQVLRDWHHRPIFLALKSLQFASFFLFLPIPNLANVRDIGVRKFLIQSFTHLIMMRNKKTPKLGISHEISNRKTGALAKIDSWSDLNWLWISGLH